MNVWEIHPKLVVFPIAFLIGGVVLDLWAAAVHRPAGRHAATTLLAVGFWSGLVAAAAGVLAFLTVPAHTDQAHELMQWHIVGTAVALVLFGGVVRARRRSAKPTPGPLLTIVGAFAGVLLGAAAHLGGLMVFRGGAGVDPAVLAPELRAGHTHGGEDSAEKPHGAAHGGEHGQAKGEKEPVADASRKPEPKTEHAHEPAAEPGAEKAQQPERHVHKPPAEPGTDKAQKPEEHAHQPPAEADKAQKPEGHAHQPPAGAGAEKAQQPEGAVHKPPAGPGTEKAQQPEKHAHQPPAGAGAEKAQKPEAGREHGAEGHPAPPDGAATRPKHLEIPAEGLTPGEPGKDYTPVVTPDSALLPWKVVGNVKVFHLIAEEVEHEFAPGLTARCWGYNGRVHGPTIEAVQGDRVRIYVTNRLPAPTSVHWHGILLPNGMDGVAGLNQPAIKPGETFVYEFTLRQHGTHMYHPHHDEMTQMAMGMMGLFVIHPRTRPDPPIDRDFAILLSEWQIPVGARRPAPNEMDFNVATLNGKAFPGTAPLVCKLGERVRIRFANLSAVDHHPMHLHGYQFRVVESDGGQIPASAQQVETTVLVQVGSSKTIEFVADAQGDWALHCHMTHHLMNQMGHGVPNLIGVDTQGLDEKMQALLPDYMTMGQTGMGDMATMRMKVPGNSIPMLGAEGPFDPITMGGMFTVLKVRDGITSYDDPGWFTHPEGTVARAARPDEFARDGITAPGEPAAPKPAAHKPGGH